MTFLELCRTVRDQCSMSGNGPMTTSNQTGQMLEVVNWVKRAYVDVQNESAYWGFLRTPFTFSTLPNVQSYSATSSNILDFGKWRVGSFRVQTSNTSENILNDIGYDGFRDCFLLGSNRLAQGIPGFVTVTPDEKLSFFPIPSDTYTIHGEYFKTPLQFSLDGDTPVFPADYHMIIVYKATMHYAVKYAANEVFIDAENNYKSLLFKLRRRFEQPVRLRGALA